MPLDHSGLECLTPGAPSSVVPAPRSVLEGSLRSTLFFLALPVLGEQLLNSGVALFDTYLAGRLSRESIAAVGLAAYVDWLATLLFALVATGTTALVARSIGAGDRPLANRFLNQSVLLAGACGVVVSMVAWKLAPLFAGLQDMQGAAGEMTVLFLRTTCWAMAFSSMTLAGSAALRGSGDTRTPMMVFTLVNLVNAAVSAGLVFGWYGTGPLGVRGIALGTLTARMLGGVVMLAILLRGRGGLQLKKRFLRPSRELAGRLLHIGVPAAWDGALLWTGQFVFLMLIARLGQHGEGKIYYAAHIVAVRLESLSYLPAVAWAAAAATVIGQSLGSGRPERARRAGHEACLQCAALAGLVGIGFFLCARELFTLMTTDPAVRQAASGPFRLLGFYQPLLAVYVVYVGALRGAGDTRFPLLMNAIGMLAVRLPLAYLLAAVLDWGLPGIWIAMCSDISVRALLAAGRFVQGRWETLRI